MLWCLRFCYSYLRDRPRLTLLQEILLSLLSKPALHALRCKRFCHSYLRNKPRLTLLQEILSQIILKWVSLNFANDSDAFDSSLKFISDVHLCGGR